MGSNPDLTIFCALKKSCGFETKKLVRSGFEPGTLIKGCGFDFRRDHNLHRQKFDKVGIQNKDLPVPHKQLIFVLEM